MSQNHPDRRTFAIISHPDAGKTTLTEKLLVAGGAIHMAGEVKARGQAVSYTHLDVYKRQDRHRAQAAHLEQLQRLRFDPLGGVDHHHRAVDRGERAIGCLLYTSRCV